jgi:putative addiction module component (TIGR02574 family)
MTDAARKILDDVLSLPEEDRVRIVTEVIASLDGPPDADWEATWLAELDRRVEDAKRAGETGTDWAEVRAELLAELRAG